MTNPKISVVIPYNGDEFGFDKSSGCIFEQNYSEELVELVVVRSSEQISHHLEAFEQRHTESVAVIESTAPLTTAQALNLGIEYCSGDYVLFLDCGDVFNAHLFCKIANALTGNTPDLISFKTTAAMSEFDLFDHEGFSLNDRQFCVFDDSTSKKRILNDPDIYEDFHAYAYNREFLISSGRQFAEDEYDRDSTFVYPLLLLSRSLLRIPEQGYCYFLKDGADVEDIRKQRIEKNLRSQLELYGLLKTAPDLFGEYYDLIDAHFLRRYFLHTIDLLRGSKEACLTVQQFQLMQLTCLKLVPKWINNDYVYSFSRAELNRLSALYKNYDSNEQIIDEFCSDAKISVIMTTYNRAYILERGMRNVLKQSWQNFEFIIVNDNSSDDTEKIIKGFDDPRIVYIRNNKNKGVSHARNLGLRAAKGNYIIYQDDDDLSRLDKLEKMVNVLDRTDDRTGAVYHEALMLTRSEGSKENDIQVIPAREMDDVRKNGYIFPALLPRNFVTTPAVMIKKKCLDDIGEFDEDLIAYEDWDLCLRLSKKYDMAFIKEPMYDYLRSNSGLISNSDSGHREKVLRSLYLIDLKYEQDRKKFNIDSNFRLVDE